MKVHIDGARIFNAATSQNIDVGNLVKDVDSITFCLSKGLTAPIGSIICGDTKFIYEAKRIRKSLGGGMRQSGVIAACGLYALDYMITQIKHDHQNTKRLAEGINNINGLSVDINNIKSNILYFNIEQGFQRTTQLSHQTKNINSYPFEIALDGIHFFASKPNWFRMVTHYGITSKDIESTISCLQNIVK